jgi:hypothetical protein
MFLAFLPLVTFKIMSIVKQSRQLVLVAWPHSTPSVGWNTVSKSS